MTQLLLAIIAGMTFAILVSTIGLLIRERKENIMPAIDDLNTQVSANHDASVAILAAVTTLVQSLSSVGVNAQAIVDATARLKTDTDALVAGVAAIPAVA